jgi:O-antigen ligase
VPVADPAVLADERNPLRKLAFYAAAGLLFLRLGVISELIFSMTGFNARLMYLFAPLAILGAFATGALRRTFTARAAWLWAGFFGWMILATPMSYWVGGSLNRVLSYGRVDFLFLVILGGLAMTWKEVRTLLHAIALAGVANVLVARWFGANDMGGRTNLADIIGSIGNSNDLASQLLLVLPFVAFVAMDSKRNMLVRLICIAAIGVGFTVILGTGSRGALIGIAVSMLFVLLYASAGQRAAILGGTVVMAMIAAVALPASTLSRLGSLFGESHVEAEQSSKSREYLFNKSLEYTRQFPIFGVGPDQFPNYEGNQRVSAGEVGNWHATHCAWTQVSAECGIPALLFFVFALGASLRMVFKTNRRAKQLGFQDIRNAAFCYLTAMIAYLVSITFLANAYVYHLPAMVGLAVSLTVAANRFMDQNSTKPRVPAMALA